MNGVLMRVVAQLIIKRLPQSGAASKRLIGLVQCRNGDHKIIARGFHNPLNGRSRSRIYMVDGSVDRVHFRKSDDCRCYVPCILGEQIVEANGLEACKGDFETFPLNGSETVVISTKLNLGNELIQDFPNMQTMHASGKKLTGTRILLFGVLATKLSAVLHVHSSDCGKYGCDRADPLDPCGSVRVTPVDVMRGPAGQSTCSRQYAETDPNHSIPLRKLRIDNILAFGASQ